MVTESVIKTIHKAEAMESPEMLLSDDDIENLKKLQRCTFDIYSNAKEKGKKNTYDNKTLDAFMIELSLVIDDLEQKKNIKNFISYESGRPTLGISVKVKHED